VLFAIVVFSFSARSLGHPKEREVATPKARRAFSGASQLFSHSEKAGRAEKVGGNRHPEDAQRKQTAADRRAVELDPGACREAEAGKEKDGGQGDVQPSAAGVRRD